MTIFDQRLQVWVFHPTKNNDLGYAGLLTFSHLAYQDRFNNQPKKSRVAWATGLQADTITAILDRLSLVGLYGDGRPRYLPDMFQEKRGTNDVEHWSLKFLSWQCLVREDDSPLSVTDCMIYSYLVCKHMQSFSPTNGWSHAYLASVLGITPKTVMRSLERLEELCLFRPGESWNVAVKLNEEQATYFKTRSVPAGRPATTGGFVPPAQTDRLLQRNTLVCRYIQKTPEYSELAISIDIAKKALPLVVDNKGMLVADWKRTVDQVMDNPEDYHQVEPQQASGREFEGILVTEFIESLGFDRMGHHDTHTEVRRKIRGKISKTVGTSELFLDGWQDVVKKAAEELTQGGKS